MKALDQMLNEAVSKVDMPLYLRGIETEEQFRKRTKMLLHDSSVDYIKLVARGYQHLMEQLKKSKENVEEFHLSEEALQALRENPKQEKTMQEIVGYSDEQMISLYMAAQEMFNERRFTEAAEAFFFLLTLSPFVPSYWIAKGVALESCDRSTEAFQIYYGGILVNILSLDLWKQAYSCSTRNDHIQEKEALKELAAQAIHVLEKEHEEAEFCGALKKLLNLR